MRHAFSCIVHGLTITFFCNTLIRAQTAPRTNTRLPASQPTSRSVDQMLSQDSQKAYGLQKLSVEERAALVRLIISLTSATQPEKTAASYLQSKGWELASISSVQRARLDEFDIDRDWIVVRSGFSNYAVERPLGWHESAGQYWIQPGFSGPALLMDESGQEYDCSLRQKKRL